MTKIYNIGLTAFGISGKVFHSPFIEAHKGFNLKAVLERTTNEAKKKYENIITCRNIEELLNTPIDIVVVNSPSITHFDYTKAALLAGKHVIVEKPFTATTDEALDLIKIAKENKLMLTVFHNRRYDSDFLLVKKILSSNVLGDLVDVEIHFDRYSPSLSLKKHKEANTAAVGNLYDLGSHLIDQAILLFGLPNAVFANIAYTRNNTLVDDFFDIKFYYETFQVTLKGSFFVKEILPSYILHGKKGSFIKPRTDTQEESLLKNISPLDENYGVEKIANTGHLNTQNIEGIFTRKNIPNEVGNYIQFYDGIYNCLTKNTNPPVTPYDAMLVIKLIEASKQSFKEKRVVAID